MIFVIPVVTAVLCMLSALLMFRELDQPAEVEPQSEIAAKTEAVPEDKAEKKTADSVPDLPENEIRKEKNGTAFPWAYCIVMICITLAVSAMFCTLYRENDIFVSLKRMGLLAIIWPIAYIDFTEYRIPNSFIILGLGYRAVLIPCELLAEGTAMRFDLMSEGIAAAALLIAAILCTVCMRGSIGIGDMKLFVVMGLLLGLESVWGAIFLALIVSFAVSVFLLATKRKTRKDAIPFGPAIVIGTFLSVALTGM